MTTFAASGGGGTGGRLFLDETDLHHRLKHGDEDELDEADLGSGLGDLLSIHEGRHRKSLSLLTVALRTGKAG